MTGSLAERPAPLIPAPTPLLPSSRLPRPQVTFEAEFQAGASGRNFGWVKLNGESLAAAVAAAGWAKVKDQGTSSKSSELEELVSALRTPVCDPIGSGIRRGLVCLACVGWAADVEIMALLCRATTFMLFGAKAADEGKRQQNSLH